jgi:hypothetical protein
MRTKKNDNNSFAPYKENPEVEAVVANAYIKYIQIRIDRALDNGMWKTHPEEFQELVNIYIEAKKSVDK